MGDGEATAGSVSERGEHAEHAGDVGLGHLRADHELGPDGLDRDGVERRRELMRLGHLAVSEGEFATIELTDSGVALLKDRTAVTLTKPMDLPKARRVIRREGDIAFDELLFERLRALRKRLADERQVPAYIIFGDTTLRAMANRYPVTVGEMDGIPGMAAYGTTKAALMIISPSSRFSSPRVRKIP